MPQDQPHPFQFDLATGACTIPDCINTEEGVGSAGPIPHAPKPDCRPRGFPNGEGRGHVPVVLGVGPDAEIVTNDAGGSQSKIPHAFTTMPLRALEALARLQSEGDAKYGKFNWRKIPELDHINHAQSHLIAHLLGDEQDEHLLHATWRLMAALELLLESEDE